MTRLVYMMIGMVAAIALMTGCVMVVTDNQSRPQPNRPAVVATTSSPHSSERDHDTNQFEDQAKDEFKDKAKEKMKEKEKGKRKGQVVTSAPPKDKSEKETKRPSRSHYWITGYWEWNGSAWLWRAGQWVMPPNMSATWHPGRWSKEGKGWIWNEGFWE